MINPEFFKALAEIEKIKLAYKMGRPLPVIAQRFIEMGRLKGISVSIQYGTKQDDKDLYAGYWIAANGKAVFQPDWFIDDGTPENIKKAVDWFGAMLVKLPPMPDIPTH